MEAADVATALVVEMAMAVTARAAVALAVVEVVAEMVTEASGLAKVVEASQSRMGTASNRQSRNASSCIEPCTIERSLQVDREERAATAATVAAVADKRVDKEAEAEGRVAAEAEWTIFAGGATRTTGRTGVGVCTASDGRSSISRTWVAPSRAPCGFSSIAKNLHATYLTSSLRLWLQNEPLTHA